jgi:hypothetical protein
VEPVAGVAGVAGVVGVVQYARHESVKPEQLGIQRPVLVKKYSLVLVTKDVHPAAMTMATAIV